MFLRKKSEKQKKTVAVPAGARAARAGAAARPVANRANGLEAATPDGPKNRLGSIFRHKVHKVNDA